MKKSTLIIILIIYLASIVAINFFGTKAKLFNVVVSVTSVECLNQSDENTEVKENSSGLKVIKTKFTEVADKNTLTGTMVQLQWRVYPDNATTKDIRFKYNKSANFEFYKDESDRETGLILFTGKALVDVEILSTDGTKIGTTVRVWAY